MYRGGQGGKKLSLNVPVTTKGNAAYVVLIEFYPGIGSKFWVIKYVHFKAINSLDSGALF